MECADDSLLEDGQGDPAVGSDSMPSNIRLLIENIWANLLKQSLDTIPYRWDDVYKTIRDYFFNSPWYFAYDFIEFVANTYRIPLFNQKFIAECNSTLEREASAYRFVDAKIVQIISKEEIAEIEEALGTNEALGPMAHHLKRALDLLADRKSPDYRNSIKESISSVEALCRRITSDDNATLGDALNLIEKEGKITLHPALKKSFNSLYGYTSAADGIRHALLDESKSDFEDAKFMLVSCSAFVNYLIAKSSKARIKLN